MPRNALLRKACGERSEDFCAQKGAKVPAFLQAVKNAADFLTACVRRPPWGPPHFSRYYSLSAAPSIQYNRASFRY